MTSLCMQPASERAKLTLIPYKRKTTTTSSIQMSQFLKLIPFHEIVTDS